MSSPTQATVTALLDDLAGGDATAFGRLLPLVYDELRALAASQLRRERPDHTLQPTALVHEVYLKLVGQEGSPYRNRGHFLAVAAQAMRRILVDHARARKRKKRSAEPPMDLTGAGVGAAVEQAADDLLAVDDALGRLAELEPRQARVVEFRYFVGLSIDETAAALEVSPATVKRDWTLARAWLQREIGGTG